MIADEHKPIMITTDFYQLGVPDFPFIYRWAISG